jgi:uncharacterized membrane protein
MATIEKSIDVDVPVRTAYNQWTQFEEFPLFMEGIKSVSQLGDRRIHWRAEVLKRNVEWIAEITEQIPDERITWRSAAGSKNAGTVSFAALGPERSRLTLSIEYDPDGSAEAAGSALGLVSARVEGDLKRFKRYIEGRGRETGQWRGEIHGTRVTHA